MISQAEKLASMGLFIYPLANNTKIPLKGSHGYKDAMASSEPWNDNPNYNIGLNLVASKLIVIDADRNHAKGVDGIENLKQAVLANNDTTFFTSTYIEKTPRGGLHIFFKLPDGVNLRNKTGFIPGVDIVTTGVPVAPTSVDGGVYASLTDKEINDANYIPRWLINMIQPQRASEINKPFPLNYSSGRKSIVGILLDSIVDGAEQGNRNQWMFKLAGSMVNTGAEPVTVYNLLLLFNKTFLSKPLPDTEVQSTLKSAFKQELRKRGVAV